MVLRLEMPSQLVVRVFRQKLPDTAERYEAKIRHYATRAPDATVQEDAPTYWVVVYPLRHAKYDRTHGQARKLL